MQRTPLCWFTSQLKDIRLYLENSRAAGITDEIADTMVKVRSDMDAAVPKADICEMYPYIPGMCVRKRRRSRTSSRIVQAPLNLGCCGERSVQRVALIAPYGSVSSKADLSSRPRMNASKLSATCTIL